MVEFERKKIEDVRVRVYAGCNGVEGQVSQNHRK